MKVAICSDVHGNLPALEQFLERTSNIDTRVFLGDMVGYCGPFPNRCVSLIRKNFDYIISGNHDRMVHQERIDDRYLKLPPRLEEGIQMSIDRTDLDTKRYLRTIPQKHRINLNNSHALLTHSHPTEKDGYVHAEEFSSLVDIVDVEYVFIGHTHQQAIREFDSCSIVNPGSVGAPKKSYSDGNYAVLDDEGDVALKSFTYDRSRLIKKCDELGLSDELVDTYG